MTKETMAAGGQRKYDYDAIGRMTSFTNARNQELIYKYDSADRLVEAAGEEYTYDKTGNVLAIISEHGTAAFTYDNLNRATSYTDVNGYKIAYTYDEVGNLKTLTYPDGQKVEYSYNAVNALTEVTDYDSRVTVYEYDRNLRLVKTTRTDGSVETTEYDKARGKPDKESKDRKRQHSDKSLYIRVRCQRKYHRGKGLAEPG